MNRRKLFGGAAAAAVAGIASKDLRLPEPSTVLVAEILPAPDGSLMQGPAILDASGKRVGQLVFRVRA